MTMVQDEFIRQGGSRTIDLFDPQDEEGEVIKQKALDQICMQYKIEEEQLKHVLYITYVVPNQQQMADQSVDEQNVTHEYSMEEEFKQQTSNQRS